MFSVVHEHRLQEYSKCRSYQTLFSYKTINEKINTINSLSCWSVTLLNFFCKFSACLNSEPAGRKGNFGNFLNGFAKGPRVHRWSWILNECNLSWKIVKYCILYVVCMIKTAPHSTLSPQTWCIKKYKRLVCTHPDLLARICKVNLSNAKNLTWSVIKSHYCS